MAKMLRCKEAGFDCQALLRAESEDEVLRQAAAHVEQVHGVTLTPEVAEQVRAAIKDA